MFDTEEELRELSRELEESGFFALFEKLAPKAIVEASEYTNSVIFGGQKMVSKTQMTEVTTAMKVLVEMQRACNSLDTSPLVEQGFAAGYAVGKMVARSQKRQKKAKSLGKAIAARKAQSKMPPDLSERLQAKTIDEVAQDLGVSSRTIYRWLANDQGIIAVKDGRLVDPYEASEDSNVKVTRKK